MAQALNALRHRLKSLKVVNERAGHANVSITLGVYAAFIPTLQADAAVEWISGRENLAEQVGDETVTIRPFPALAKRPSH